MLGFVFPVIAAVRGGYDVIRAAFAGFAIGVGLALIVRTLRKDGLL